MKARGRYAVVSRRTWGDRRFRALSAPREPNARDLWLYLLTCPSAALIPGIFVLRAETIAADLGWPLRGMLAVWAELEHVDEHDPEELAVADWATPLVWLPKAIRHDPPNAENHVKGWARRWVDLPESPLLARIWEGVCSELKRINPAFLPVFTDAIPKPTARAPSLRSLSRSLSLPLSTAAAVSRVPVGERARGEQGPDQSGGSGSHFEAPTKPNGLAVRCPIDLRLDDGQLSTLEINTGCNRENGLKLCRHFAAKWQHDEPLPLATWFKRLYSAVVGSWQNPAERSRILPPPGFVEHEENTRTPDDEAELERLKVWRAKRDAELDAEAKRNVG